MANTTTISNNATNLNNFSPTGVVNIVSGLSNPNKLAVGANQQINQVRQQIALSNPTLLDIDKLSLQRNFAVQNVENQFGTQRTSDLLTGKSSLLSIAAKSNTSQDAINRIKGISSRKLWKTSSTSLKRLTRLKPKTRGSLTNPMI